jgi:hypothetical protein
VKDSAAPAPAGLELFSWWPQNAKRSPRRSSALKGDLSKTTACAGHLARKDRIFRAKLIPHDIFVNPRRVDKLPVTLEEKPRLLFRRLGIVGRRGASDSGRGVLGRGWTNAEITFCLQ